MCIYIYRGGGGSSDHYIPTTKDSHCFFNNENDEQVGNPACATVKGLITFISSANNTQRSPPPPNPSPSSPPFKVPPVFS